MGIRSSLRRIAWISFGLIAAMAASLAYTIADARRAQLRHDLAARILAVQADRQLARDDYLLRREDRARAQWHAKTEELRGLLDEARTRFSAPGDEGLLRRARSDFDETTLDFSSLEERYAKAGASPAELEAERLLVSQYLLRAYALRSSLMELQDRALSGLASARDREVAALASAAAIVSLFLAASALLINRRFGRRLSLLLDEIWKIGNDLDHRIAMDGNDELKSLAEAAGSMAARVREGCASIESLKEEIGRRREAEALLSGSEARLKAILRTAMDGFWLIDAEGRILDANDTYCRMGGWTREEIVGRTISDFEAEESPEEAERHRRRLIAAGEDRFETKHRRKDGSVFAVESSVQYRPEHGQLVAFIRDVSDRKREEEVREVVIGLLETINAASSRVELVHSIVARLKEWLDCDAVGIRLKAGCDYPYYETSGFAAEFVLAEKSLCEYGADGGPALDSSGNPVLSCMCGNILRGRFDPSKPFFTKRGSFWSNSTTRLLASTTEADRQARTRNRCNGEGYESVGLFAMRFAGETFGLIQVNARREGLFTPSLLALLEQIADNMAIALSQAATREELVRNLREKDALLGELFHRTRNNMQVIISILASEAKLTDDALVEEIVERTSGRIMAMSIMQQQLYENEDLSRIELAAFCRQLVQMLEGAAPETGRRPGFAVEAAPIVVPIESAMPFSLAAYELAARAVRAAGGGGKIRIVLRRDGRGNIEFTVSRDGAIAIAAAEGAAESLGLRIAASLIEGQLGGSMGVDVPPSGACRISFPEPAA